MSLYPDLEKIIVEKDPTQQFRLQKISELESFLRSEVDTRCRLHKKYRRAVNVLDGACASLGTVCLISGAIGAGLLASGVGFTVGLVLEGLTGVAGLLDVSGIAISRRCSLKSQKHESINILASSKLNTIHSHISKALEDCSISDAEYKLILEEIEKYRAMKQEIRSKSVVSGPIIDDATKNGLIQQGRELEKAAFIKKLTGSD